jgi:hypothetical protein
LGLNNLIKPPFPPPTCLLGFNFFNLAIIVGEKNEKTSAKKNVNNKKFAIYAISN